MARLALPSVISAISVICVICVSVIALVTPREANAYLDPATGSAIIQAVVASVMGALFVLKLYWRKIRAFFGGQAAAAKREQPTGEESAHR